MMKLALCAVILAAMGMAGVRIGSAYRRRERLLSQLVQELQRLEEQVRMERPLQLALQQKDMPLFSRLAEPIGRLGAAGAWRLVCDGAAERDLLSAMEAPERRAMDDFWGELGTLNRQNQLKRFAETGDTLVRLRDQAAEEAAQRSRLYGSLGTLLGLMAVVLLW